jgi:hypothetical protein
MFAMLNLYYQWVQCPDHRLIRNISSILRPGSNESLQIENFHSPWIEIGMQNVVAPGLIG